ncbi:MAG: OmpA family protein, partial [Myxococcota bacterium]
FKDGGSGEMPLRFRVDVVAGLEIEAPPDRLDLANNRVQLRMSRPAGRCQAQVFVPGGRSQRDETAFSGEAPWTWLTVSWRQPEGRVAKVRLLCFDEDGFSRGLELIPTAPPKLLVPKDRLDVEGGKLELQMSSPAVRCDVELTYDGAETQRGSATFDGAAAGTWLPISWQNPGGDAVLLRIALTCVDPTSASATLEIYPWQLDVPHEEVNFATARWQVLSQEEPKLARALDAIQTAIRRYGKIITVRLYVVGYTDTVGDRASNQALSLNRAYSIATYFRKQGVTVPIRYAGFGEDVLAVQTVDQTDEVRNRRARYILAVEHPEKASWKVIR